MKRAGVVGAGAAEARTGMPGGRFPSRLRAVFRRRRPLSTAQTLWISVLSLTSTVLILLSARHRQLPFDMAADRTILRNANGVEVTILHLGATIQSLLVPDIDGNFADVVLGFDDVEPYANGTSPYMGAVIGRVANRIAEGRFYIGDQEVMVSVNEGSNTLHGGKVGWDKAVWKVVGASPAPAGAAKAAARRAMAAGAAGGSGSAEASGSPPAHSRVTLEHTSPDGDMGFPGEVRARVTYELTPENALKLTMTARSTKETPVNMAGHSYFNLGGHASGDVLAHTLEIDADYYTPIDAVSCPRGEYASVRDTPFDFFEPRLVGERIAALGGLGEHRARAKAKAPGAEVAAYRDALAAFWKAEAETKEAPGDGDADADRDEEAKPGDADASQGGKAAPEGGLSAADKTSVVDHDEPAQTLPPWADPDMPVPWSAARFAALRLAAARQSALLDGALGGGAGAGTAKGRTQVEGGTESEKTAKRRRALADENAAAGSGAAGADENAAAGSGAAGAEGEETAGAARRALSESAPPSRAKYPTSTRGYDHNYVLFGIGPDAATRTLPGGRAVARPRPAATLVDVVSGRGLRVKTTAPGLQVYSGNFLDSSLVGKGNHPYQQHAGIALETQGFPNAVNEPAYPSVMLKPNQEYSHEVVYEFFALQPMGGQE